MFSKTFFPPKFLSQNIEMGYPVKHMLLEKLQITNWSASENHFPFVSPNFHAYEIKLSFKCLYSNSAFESHLSANKICTSLGHMCSLRSCKFLSTKTWYSAPQADCCLCFQILLHVYSSLFPREAPVCSSWAVLGSLTFCFCSSFMASSGGGARASRRHSHWHTCAGAAQLTSPRGKLPLLLDVQSLQSLLHPHLYSDT